MPRIARAETVATERRRRQPGSLNRLATSNLGVPEECKDPEYHYHWVNDKRGRIQALTTHDDYDVVTPEMLEEQGRRNRTDFSMTNFTTGVYGGVSIPVERDGTHAVLLRKPQRFYDADYEEGCNARQAMMEARVYEGDLANDTDRQDTLSPDITYVPKENTLGATAPRRRGPIPRRMK